MSVECYYHFTLCELCDFHKETCVNELGCVLMGNMCRCALVEYNRPAFRDDKRHDARHYFPSTPSRRTYLHG